jgi:hypothetical protein
MGSGDNMQMSKANSDLANTALKRWVGQTCDEIVRREHDWSFRFNSVGWLGVGSPWRIIAAGRIAHADEDDGQKFGLPEPVNGAERAMGLLSGKAIVSVDVAPISGDLRVHFFGGTLLEVFNNSSGYEAWHAVAKDGAKRTEVVAQGGGTIAMLDS